MRDSKQILFPRKSDLVVVAKTPQESGLTVQVLYEALKEIVETVRDTDRLTVIFEDAEGEVSWTIGEVAIDKEWLRLS